MILLFCTQTSYQKPLMQESTFLAYYQIHLKKKANTHNVHERAPTMKHISIWRKEYKKKKINNKIYDQNSKPYALLRPKTQSPIAIDIHRTTIIVSAKANTHSQMIRNNFEVSELIQLD